MSTCSICLNEVRSTRANPPLRCGHLFHSSCLCEWKRNTCPVCRKVIDTSHFKVMVTVHNNYSSVSNTISLSEESILSVIDTFDVTFDIENAVDLDSILTDFGVSLADFDTGLLDTE